MLELNVMDAKTRYELPPLPYTGNALEPYISGEQLSIHHDKHHLAYVNGANADLEKLEKARREGSEIDMKAVLKDLSWNVGGHILHSLFWTNLAPAGHGGGVPHGRIADMISAEFGSYDRFKKEFAQAAASVEGSGWAALALCPLTNRLQIMQVEKHNQNVVPSCTVLLVLDVFEHAYYIDYRNERGKFIDAFWKIVNWEEVNRRL
jgi:Fe-Mn family superoxide dismutase